MSLFGNGVPELAQKESADAQAPLAERMRPRSIADYVGQEHLLAPGKPLRVQLEHEREAAGGAGSLIFWGPPGVGKTTLAKLFAEATRATFIEFSAVLSGVKEIKTVMADAEKAAAYGTRTLLFVDEIHRFNKAQQDAFLPYVERGTIRLIGATTENPSFEIIGALLSRCRVYTLLPLSEDSLVELQRRALADPQRGLGGLRIEADEDALRLLAAFASGDARSAYNALEVAATLISPASSSGTPRRLTRELAAEALQTRALLYDKSGEEHYNLISALHKSIRNSDADAALYWLARMLAGGEDPLYIARRLVRMASEDIGLAAPEALNLCLSARDAVDFLGSPEGDLALAEAAVYLALAPKSNALYTAFNATMTDVRESRAEPVPLHLRNAPTRLMKELDYGKGYKYAHDEPGRVGAMECLPENLRERRYYVPTEEGRERLLAQRMREVRALQEKSRSATE